MKRIINFSALQSRIECPHSPVALHSVGNGRQARRGDEGRKKGRRGRGTRCCHTATSCFCGRFSWTREVYNGAQHRAADGGGVGLAHQCGQRYLLPPSRPSQSPTSPPLVLLHALPCALRCGHAPFCSPATTTRIFVLPLVTRLERTHNTAATR